MKTLKTMTLVVAVLGLTGGVASAQTKVLQGETMTVTVTIEAIEQSTRTMTVKDDKGIYETLQVGPEVKRFSELKVGDKITARYYENVVIRVKKPNEAAVDLDTAGLNRAGGTRPAATAAAQRTITVTVTAKDLKTSSITVEGPNNYKYSRKVTDKKAFDTLKVGDRLDMTWTEALLISVETAK